MNLKNLIREKYDKYFFNHKSVKIQNSTTILNFKDATIPEKSIWNETKIYQFDWGTASIIPNLKQDLKYSVHFDIIPSILLENSEIRHESHISKIEKLSVKFKLIDNGYNSGMLYFRTIPNTYYNYHISRTAYKLAYQDTNEREISVEPIVINFNNNDYDHYYMPNDEEHFRIYVENNLIPKIKLDLLENFKQEIINFNNTHNTILFLDKINPDVINNAFAFVIDLVPESSIINVHDKSGFIFNIPLKNFIPYYGFKLDNNMKNILFEITEGINKLKIGYDDFDEYIYFNSNSISISLYPRLTNMLAQPFNSLYGTSGSSGIPGTTL